MASDYSKLVEALRCCASGACDSEKCDYIGMGAYGCMIGLAQDAADAIEDLQKGLTTLQKCYEIADKKADELLTQLPKLGEWIIHGEPPMLVIECSVCGQKYFNHVMQEKAKYCSMCGAKMEVQDV